MIAVVVMRRHRGWGRNFCRRRCRRLVGRLAHRRRGDRLVAAVRAIDIPAGRPMVIGLPGLGASAVVVAMCIFGSRPVGLSMRILGARAVVTAICARWPMITVPQT